MAYCTKLVALHYGCPDYVLWYSGMAPREMPVPLYTIRTETMHMLPGAVHGIWS
jgi:hypothetical protein